MGVSGACIKGITLYTLISLLFLLKPPLCAWSLFKSDCSQSAPQRAELDKVCEQWNVFERRQPVTMDLLCVYPKVTPVLSRYVYYCWSRLESIWVVGFGLSDPCQEQYFFLLWHVSSAGIASLLHLALAPRPEQLRDTDRKKTKGMSEW